jgi:hypothetical protein
MAKKKTSLPIKATIKQKRLAKLVSDNIRKGAKSKPLGSLMVEAGYSESTSKRPSEIVKSSGFISILEAAGCSDELIAKQLNRGLNKNGESFVAYKIRDMSIGRLLVLKKHTNTFGDEAIEALRDFVKISLPPIDKLPED